MKTITDSQRPKKGHHQFYDDDIIKITDKAILIKKEGEITEEKIWIPESKVVVLTVTDTVKFIDVNDVYVLNPNFGKEKKVYFVPSVLIKKSNANVSLESAIREGSFVDQKNLNFADRIF